MTYYFDIDNDPDFDPEKKSQQTGARDKAFHQWLI
jgi:hypothetical protein